MALLLLLPLVLRTEFRSRRLVRRTDSCCSTCVLLKSKWGAMGFVCCPRLSLRVLSGLRYFISSPCPAMLLTLLRLLPRITMNTSRQCTTTFLSVSYMVRDSDKRLAAATPVSESSCSASQVSISYSTLHRSTSSCELHLGCRRTDGAH